MENFLEKLRAWLNQNFGGWKKIAGLVVEIAIIVAWATWFGRAYLDTDPHVWPNGTAMGYTVMGHYFWTDLQECGLCALWNGHYMGGRPAFADLYGSQFHPLVAITTLIFGVMNGTKIALVLILVIAGLIQWWLGKILNLGRFARVWGALLIVVGGHIATKNDEGNFGLLLANIR